MKNFDIKTAVIGVGSMGKNHARVYSEISNLVAVVDPNKKQGLAVAEKYGVKWFEDYKSIITDVDAVSVAVPTQMHMAVALDLIEANIDLLIEKPLAGSVEDAKKIVDLAEKNDTVLGVGQIERYNNVIQEAKSRIHASSWGDILTLSAKRFSNYPGRISDVGVIFDLTIHDADIIRYLVADEVSKVFAMGGKSKNKYHEDYVNLLMYFKNGMIGLCETNWLTPMKVRSLDITTTDRYVHIDYLNQSIEVLSSAYLSNDDSNLYRPEIKVNKELIKPESEEPLKSELVDFLESVRDRKKPLVTGIEGLKVVEIVEAGLESLNKGKIVNL